MLSTIIASCVTAIIEILTNFTAYLKNKSANTDLTDYEKNRKLQEEINKHTLIIQDAQKKGDLDEIRKQAGE